jgi:hypothetical protein
MRRHLHLPLTLAAVALTVPASAEGQRRAPNEPGALAGWAPIQVGARFGFDNNSTGKIVGAQIRIPVLPSGVAELMPGGDITFHSGGLKDYEFTLDGLFVASGALYAGGGLAVRSSIWDEGGIRETKSGPTAVFGIKSESVGGAPFGIQLEVRWVWVDEDIKPQLLTFGINFPLWRARRR